MLLINNAKKFTYFNYFFTYLSILHFYLLNVNYKKKYLSTFRKKNNVIQLNYNFNEKWLISNHTKDFWQNDIYESFHDHDFTNNCYYVNLFIFTWHYQWHGHTSKSVIVNLDPMSKSVIVNLDPINYVSPYSLYNTSLYIYSHEVTIIWRRWVIEGKRGSQRVVRFYY